MNTWEHYNRDRYVDAVKVTRFALSRLGTPRDIYADMHQPRVSRVSRTLGTHIIQSYRGEHPDWKDPHQAGDIIYFGVIDTHNLLHPYLSRASSRESAMNILHHERTMRHLALAARRRETEFNGLVRRVEVATLGLPIDPPHFKTPEGTTAQTNGCPAASIGDDEAPTKEFVDFSLFSGEVLIEAIDHHKLFVNKKNSDLSE